MDLHNLSNDEAILAELGRRLAQQRIDQGLTQAELAREAGIGKRTIERIEAGFSAQSVSLIRILRVLRLLESLELLLPPAEPGPMDLLQRKGKIRRRASSRHRKTSKDHTWSWDDES